MIHIKSELEAMNETWRITQIVIDKDGKAQAQEFVKDEGFF
jgi:hypothetical protein